MISHVQRLGNSLVVRIPQIFADQTGLSPNDPVEIAVQNGRIILTPLKSYSLETLVAGIGAKNQHAEWAMGPAVGDEVW